MGEGYATSRPSQLVAGKRAVRLFYPTGLSLALVDALRGLTGQSQLELSITKNLNAVVGLGWHVRHVW